MKISIYIHTHTYFMEVHKEMAWDFIEGREKEVWSFLYYQNF